MPTPHFDPDAAAGADSGLFGLPFTPDQAQVLIIPVPFDATVSFGHGTCRGPAAVLEASKQVDLFDHQFGRIYERGIAMLDENPRIREIATHARSLAVPIIEKGGATAAMGGGEDRADLDIINQAGAFIADYTYQAAKQILASGRTPGLLGGDHSTPFGAIGACAEHAKSLGKTLGILHIDAHMDLRHAFEGFTWSHASIFYNVLKNIPAVSKLIQIGIRDYSEGEVDFAREHGHGREGGGGRVDVHFDYDWHHAIDASGASFASLSAQAIESLPELVYVSFDIDALDPALCPNTGTPVPGGMSFNQASTLLETLSRSGRKVIGFDLVEVSPPPTWKPDSGLPDINAITGSRILYKLCGLTAT